MRIHLVMGVAVAIAIALATWLSLSQDVVAPGDEAPYQTSPAEVTTDEQSAKVSDFAGSGSFLDLIALGRPLMCQFDYVATDTNAAVAGVVKLSGDYARIDFEMQQAGESYVSHMIQDVSDIYTWSDSSAGSFAMKMSRNNATAVSSEGQEYSRPIDLSYDVEYDCQEWDVDETSFTPPQDVTFMNMADMMHTMMPVSAQ